MSKILIIEDNEDLATGLELNLKKEGYKVFKTASGEDGLKTAFRENPDLIVLDVMLPGSSGLDVCRQLRQKSIHTPIIMLTAKSDELDRVVDLELGADDYVTKPFSPRELVSRVRAVLRRNELAVGTGVTGEIVVDERLKLDLSRREVWVEGKLVKLRPTEYRLLYHLVQNAGWVLTYDQLLTKVWGYEYRDEPHYVRLYINYLRQKLEEDPANPKYILTERGVGYRFVDYRRAQNPEAM